MGYAEQRISGDAELWTSCASPGEQRVLPDGCVDLIFDGSRLLVAGPDTVARVHHNRTAGTLWAVRMHSGRGPARLGLPAAELTDRLVALDDLWGHRRAALFTDAVADDPLRVLATWARGGDVDPFGVRLRSLLAAGRGVGGAADAFGYSARQLNRRTHERFGYGPAHLSRVLRLQRALPHVDGGLAGADIALRCGYFDQAHLVRDVRDLTGLTPSALRRERVRSVQDEGPSGALPFVAWT